MSKTLKAIVLTAVGAVMAIGAFLQFQAAPQTPQAELAALDLPTGTNTGELAPDFSATTLSGDSFRLNELRGQIVVLNAFASWCGPCRVETPHLVEVSNESPGDLVLVGLNQEETDDAVAGYRDDFAVPYPLVLNPDGALTELYPLRGLPTTWFIDPQGVVQYVHAGPMTKEMMLRVLDDMRAGREPNPFSG